MPELDGFVDASGAINVSDVTQARRQLIRQEPGRMVRRGESTHVETLTVTDDQIERIETQWSPYSGGSTLGTAGSESGVILADDEHADGARITLARIQGVPGSVTSSAAKMALAEEWESGSQALACSTPHRRIIG